MESGVQNEQKESFLDIRQTIPKRPISTHFKNKIIGRIQPRPHLNPCATWTKFVFFVYFDTRLR